MKDDITLTVHTDKSGSWIEVPMLMLVMLDIHPSELSNRSRCRSFGDGDDHKYIYVDFYADGMHFLDTFENCYGDPPILEEIDYGERSEYMRDTFPLPDGRKITVH